MNLIDIDRALVKKGGLRQFIKLAWPQVEPARPFVAGWHIDAIAEHLEAISHGQLGVSSRKGKNRTLRFSFNQKWSCFALLRQSFSWPNIIAC